MTATGSATGVGDMAVTIFPDGAERGRSDEALTPLERRQYLEAAERALSVYPGALGELVHRELRAFAEFGFRLAADRLIPRLAAEVLSEVQHAGHVRRGVGVGDDR